MSADLIKRIDDVISAKVATGEIRYPLVFNLLAETSKEMERLQRIIDSRPAINAALPDSYIKWSQSIYVMEASQVLDNVQ